VDFSRVPHVLGVPRFFYRKVLREVRRGCLSAWRGDRVGCFDAELWLWFFAGVLRQRWRDRGRQRPAPGTDVRKPHSLSEA